MKSKAFWTALSLLPLAGCATGGPNPIMSMYGPHVVEGNAAYVVIYDAIGLADKQLAIANDHCAKFGKVPRYRSNQSNNWECSTNSLCSVYDCEK